MYWKVPPRAPYEGYDKQRVVKLGLELQGVDWGQRVSLDGSDNLLQCPVDVDRDQVGNCSDEWFGIVTCGIGNERILEEETGEQERSPDVMGDDRLPSPNGPIEPESDGVVIQVQEYNP